MQVCKTIALKMAGHLDCVYYKANVAKLPKKFINYSCRHWTDSARGHVPEQYVLRIYR